MDAGSLVDNRYEVCRPLSIKGGMGDVYLCLDRKLHRQVAVKLIKPEHAHKPEFRERFQREVASAIALEGYDVVQILDSGECQVLQVPYYVMEYLRGRDLSQELTACGAFELTRALEVLLNVCKVIAAVHARNIVHRDLKPSNLFLEGPPSPRRSVRVLDFGVARALGAPRDGELTQLGGQPGSPNYMSPEQQTNELQVGIQADIWALGTILFELVVGEKAWPGEPFEARKHVLEDDIPSVRTRRPELPAELDRIIRKCVEKRPESRYTSVRTLETDLRELVSAHRRSGETLPTFVSSAPRSSKPHPPRLPRLLTWGGLSILIALLIALSPWWHFGGVAAPPAGSQAHGGGVRAAPQPVAVQSPVTRDEPVPMSVNQREVGLPPAAATVPPAVNDSPIKKTAKATRGVAVASAPTTPARIPSAAAAPKLSRSETRLKAN